MKLLLDESVSGLKTFLDENAFDLAPSVGISETYPRTVLVGFPWSAMSQNTMGGMSRACPRVCTAPCLFPTRDRELTQQGGKAFEGVRKGFKPNSNMFGFQFPPRSLNQRVV